MENLLQLDKDTIAAIATGTGKSGIGIVRISGPLVSVICKTLTQKKLEPRKAHFSKIYSGNEIIDECVVIFFPGPASFTGEDVLEIQAHGNIFLLNKIMNTVFSLGVREARPGEFSERAFLNNKIDLTQAEAIADLINAGSEQAASCAVQSLQGVFSEQINLLVDEIIKLRIYTEASIDFPEEEIDFLDTQIVKEGLTKIEERFLSLKQKAHQGVVLSEGMTIVLAGRPNAGKSSLLNALSGRDSAIVTDIAGTTRDILKEHISIDGIPLHVLDTAGIRESNDPVEIAGINKAWQEIKKADLVLFLSDSSLSEDCNLENLWPEVFKYLPLEFIEKKIILIRNKADISGIKKGVTTSGFQFPVITLSVKNEDDISMLFNYLKSFIGFGSNSENQFSARRRHIQALDEAYKFIKNGIAQLNNHGAGELLAEDLRQAQTCLGSITGQLLPDELLGKIFSDFCIGK